MSGSAVNNLGAVSAAAPSAHRLDEHTFNDYHFSCFAAMETVVTVVPRFTLARVECLGGTYGPFEPNYPVELPLWLALHLRQTDTCTIVPPPYLRLAFLNGVLAREQASDGNFEALPFYFFEVAKRLCEHDGGGHGASSSSVARPSSAKGSGGGGGHAADDVPHVAEVVRLVQEIKAVRQRKLKQSMGVFEPEGSAMFIPGIRLTHIICNELHFLRTSFAVVLQQACEMEARRALSTAGFTGGSARPIRMPHISLASATSMMTTPARLSGSSTGGGGVGTSVVSSSFVATAEGPMAAPTLTQDGVSSVGGTSLDPSQPLPTPVQAVGDGTSTVTPSQAESVAPLVQPPAKKRRTLRQT